MGEPAVIDRPVVFVHGLGGSTESTWRHNGWLDLVADAGRTAIGIDLLGHGSAPKPYEPAAYADLADAVIAQLPEAEVDAVGFSLGARVLLACAAQAPGRFARLVLIGVGANLFDASTENRDKILAAMAGDGDLTDPFVRYFADLAADPSADAQALAALLTHESTPLTADALSPVTMPVHVLLGDNDFAGPAGPLLAALPHASFAELRNTDHFATPKSMQCIDEALRFVEASPF